MECRRRWKIFRIMDIIITRACRRSCEVTSTLELIRTHELRRRFEIFRTVDLRILILDILTCTSSLWMHWHFRKMLWSYFFGLAVLVYRRKNWVLLFAVICTRVKHRFILVYSIIVRLSEPGFLFEHHCVRWHVWAWRCVALLWIFFRAGVLVALFCRNTRHIFQ